MYVHPSVTVDRIMAAVEADDYTGFCTRCGAENGGIEPDAERAPCENCEEEGVYGAEQLLLYIA